ncbi:LAQU0S08e03246g1_1 [Lachancea quebecensis]|uniref:LAQU0S08e03246g1_1 n=1 Tax=Lachancea quebecensis TaxID=1654605 RepID=A0A0P1KT26_9SACH|nr:LAQU0S08e03246g1_1 [Lachancea quebecensis]
MYGMTRYEYGKVAAHDGRDCHQGRMTSVSRRTAQCHEGRQHVTWNGIYHVRRRFPGGTQGHVCVLALPLFSLLGSRCRAPRCRAPRARFAPRACFPVPVSSFHKLSLLFLRKKSNSQDRIRTARIPPSVHSPGLMTLEPPPHMPPVGRWQPNTGSNAPLAAALPPAAGKTLPTTSRFKSSLEATPSPLSLDQHSPHLYSQHRIRPNAPFDIAHIKSRRLVHAPEPVCQTLKTDSGWSYTLAPGSVPCFRIPQSEIPDPIAFYHQIEDVGRRYGAVKLHIIQSSPAPAAPFALNTELFWFKARRQSLCSFQEETRRKLDLHHRLYKYHSARKSDTGRQPFSKIPSIDKRPLDLYRLRECVQLRGGFQEVCHKKLWAQIGRELGYSGRIMSSLSTSLRSAYLKVFLEFDKEEERQRASASAATTTVPTKIHIILPSSTEGNHRDPSSKKRSPNEASVSLENAVKKHKASKVQAYQVAGSAVEFSRLRDILRYKGFFTNFENLTEPRKNLTKPSASTLPGYQFTFWKNASEIYDKSAHETRNAPIYNIRQYYEKAQKHFDSVAALYQQRSSLVLEKSDSINLHDFEKLFFDILCDESACCNVDTGINLPSSVHGSGFPTVSKDVTSGPNTSSAWNLNNIPLSPNSLLRFMDADFGDHLNTRLDLGMLFSVKGWSTEDNFLPNIDYHHAGSSKLWYVVPPQEMEKFEGLVEISKKDRQSADSGISADPLDKSFLNSEVYQCFLDTCPQHQVSSLPPRINTHSIGRFCEPAACAFPDDWQFHPEKLKANSIRVFKIVQDPGSYILKFPKTYSTSISSGFSISENALFAPASWLESALESEKWLSKNGLLPAIQTFQLLFNIVKESSDKKLVSKARQILIDLASEELAAREELAKRLNDRYTIQSNVFDFISDKTLEPTGASKVLLTSAKDCFTLSLRQFLDNMSYEGDKLFIFGRDMQQDGISISIHEFYSNEELETLLQEDHACAASAVFLSEKTAVQAKKPDQDILASYENLVNQELKGQRIPLAKVSLYCEALSQESSPQAHQLSRSLKNARSTASRCNQLLTKINKEKRDLKFLGFGSGFALKDLAAAPFHYSVAELQSLYLELAGSSISFPEMFKVFELCHRVEAFQSDAQSAVESNDLGRLQEMYLRGWSLGIRSKYHDLLACRISEEMWLSIYEKIIERRESICEDEHEYYASSYLLPYLKYGIKCVKSALHRNKLEQVRNMISRSQEIAHELGQLFKKKSSKIPIERLSNILDTLNQYPFLVESRLREALEAVMDTFSKHREGMSSSFDQLDVNDEYYRLLAESPDARPLFKLNLIDKFDGSCNDKRLSLPEVPNRSIFSKHIKDCRSWLQQVNRLVPRKPLWAKIQSSIQLCFSNDRDTWASKSQPNEEPVYCFCRRGDSGSKMVACEVCGEWYHTTCINKGKWSLVSNEKTVFVCPICCPSDVPDFGLVDYSQLESMVMASLKLKVIPDRRFFGQFFEIFKASASFKQVVGRDVLKGDGTLRENLPMVQIKFYLRKLLGAGVRMPKEIGALQNACQKHDTDIMFAFSQRNIKIVTGYEATGSREASEVQPGQVVIKSEGVSEISPEVKTEESSYTAQ